MKEKGGNRIGQGEPQTDVDPEKSKPPTPMGHSGAEGACSRSPALGGNG